MKKPISTTRQHDLFDHRSQRWNKLAFYSREKIKSLLTQLLIEAFREPSVIKNKENSHASEN